MSGMYIQWKLHGNTLSTKSNSTQHVLNKQVPCIYKEEISNSFYDQHVNLSICNDFPNFSVCLRFETASSHNNSPDYTYQRGFVPR